MRPFRLLNVFFFFFTLSAHSSCLNALIIAGIKAGGLQQYKVEDIQNSPLLPHQKVIFSAVSEASNKLKQHLAAAPHPSLNKVVLVIDPNHSNLNADNFDRLKVHSAFLKHRELVESKAQELDELEQKIYDLFYQNLSPNAAPPEGLEWDIPLLFELLENNSTGLLDMVSDKLVQIEIQAEITKFNHLLELLTQSKDMCDATHELYQFLDDEQSLRVFKEWLNELFRLHKIYYDAQQKVNKHIDSASDEDMKAIIEWMNHE